MADLLTHTPSPEPQRYEKKAEQNNHDSVDGNKTRDSKGIIVQTLCKGNFNGNLQMLNFSVSSEISKQ